MNGSSFEGKETLDGRMLSDDIEAWRGIRCGRAEREVPG